MDKRFSRRNIIQSLGALAFNGNLKGFVEGNIYTGNGKQICVPVLNCYSCPGALGSCPIGSAQSVANSSKFSLSHYVLGLLVLFGIVGGRIFCGYLCPFGFFQDLLFKIKSRKLKHGKISNVLKYLKYIILGLFVFVLPILTKDSMGLSDPLFCKYICPAGTLFAGLPLIGMNPLLQNSLGGLFIWKLSLAIVIVILSIVLFRPFCKFLCPLGAFYALFNNISFYKFNINHNCISCGRCKKACGYEIYTKETPNSPECIRCDECIIACPTNAIEKEFLGKKLSSKSSKSQIDTTQ